MEDKIKNFFGFSRIPFSKNIPTSSIFISSQIKEVSARLMLAVQNEDVALLTGAVGCGKSTAIRFFVQNLDPSAFRVIYLPAYPFKIGELAKQILDQLHIQPPGHAAKAIRLLEQTIIQLSKDKGIKPVIIIDEAQDLPIPTLQSLKNFVNFDMDSTSRLMLLLCGQKELSSVLISASLEALLRRIRIICDMSSISLEDTVSYIKHQMKNCGVDKTVFSDDAVSSIFNFSKGIISDINCICFRLIILAVSEGKDIIESSMLDKIGFNKTKK